MSHAKKDAKPYDPHEIVNVVPGDLPADYHCRCKFCTGNFSGVLIRADGTKYSRLERRKYYSKFEQRNAIHEGGHIAKTPLHVARWAVQNYSKPGDWVLDPTMGAGTTAVEALNHGCSVFGVEIQFIDIIENNIAAVTSTGADYLDSHTDEVLQRKWCIIHGDARDLETHIVSKLPADHMFDLVINNPPYSGDQAMYADKGAKNKLGALTSTYSREFDNLAFNREGDKYWIEMAKIYTAAVARLRVGGRFVIGIKDQIRDGKPDELHRLFGEMMESIPGLVFETVAILPHHPTTFFMNTYPKAFPDRPMPRYQSIVVFRKVA